MNAATPKTIPEYLDQLRHELRDADPALLQDALYDAEEYLRSELAENPGTDEATLLANIATSYGAPEEVAAIYRDTEVRVSKALSPPAAKVRRSVAGQFFGVATDSRAWMSLFYMLLSLATGIVYFTVVTTGLSMSLGLAVLIIGIPFAILFIGIVRLLALVEGRMVEVMLGERMPRRPLYAERGLPLLTRIGRMFTDPRTWSTMLYMLLMLPLGVVYFTVAVTGLSFSLGLIGGSVAAALGSVGLGESHLHMYPLPMWDSVLWVPVLFALGVVGLFVMLHLARGIGYLHGALAKNLLVKTAQH
jgi:uncharacterized membrane protein